MYVKVMVVPMKPMEKLFLLVRKEWPAVLLLALPPLFLFTSLRPDPEGGDSAELISAVWSLGIPHATGSPLYLWLGKIAASIPGMEVAAAVNGMSAFFGAAAILLFALAVRELTGSLLAGSVAMAGLAAAKPFWYLATLAGICTLHHFLLAATLLFLFRWRRTGDARSFYLAMYAAAMNGAHHGGVFLFAPAYVLFVLTAPSKLPPLRSVLLSLLLAPLALSVYLHHPIRHADTPPIDSFVEIENRVKWGLISEELAGTTFLERFRYQIEGGGPRTKLSWFGEASAKNRPRLTPYFRGSLGTFFLGLGLAGLLRAAIIGPRGAGFLLLYCFAVNTLFYLNFLSLELDDFLIPSLFLSAVGAGIMLDDLRRLIGTTGIRGRIIAPAALLALFAVNTREVLLRTESGPGYRHAAGIVNHERTIITADFPPKSQFLLPRERAAAFRYLQVVEGLRPDLEFHSVGESNYLAVALKLAPRGPLFVENVQPEMRRHFHISSREGFFELVMLDEGGKSVD